MFDAANLVPTTPPPSSPPVSSSSKPLTSIYHASGMKAGLPNQVVHSINQVMTGDSHDAQIEAEDVREQDKIREQLYEQKVKKMQQERAVLTEASHKTEVAPHSLAELSHVDKSKLLSAYGKTIVKKTSARHTGKFSIEYKMRALRKKFPTLLSNLSNQDISKIGTEIREVQKPMVLGHSLDRLKKRKVISDLRKKHLSKSDISDVKKIIGTP